MDRETQQLETLRHYTREQADAARRLFEMAQRCLDSGGGSTCAKVLLGVYNGRRFPLNLSDLRSLDNENLRAAFTVIETETRSRYVEIHVLLDAVRDASDTQATLEHWARELMLPGRAPKAALKRALA